MELYLKVRLARSEGLVGGVVVENQMDVARAASSVWITNPDELMLSLGRACRSGIETFHDVGPARVLLLLQGRHVRQRSGRPKITAASSHAPAEIPEQCVVRLCSPATHRTTSRSRRFLTRTSAKRMSAPFPSDF